ncbi:methylated-DNA--[protein]-cysteine S-methyltransferase [Ramlibacter tataouinensis]|uniref:Methylated DNA-protein cysteine methyltransferase-like protein n=1 Tax=Ramlibacter tataouinensis (strain ATCC BAA-407 / DSM 14655 / LMG 21543 / TTB310) TaxID=365046 RepID=F5XXV2_RAMTT|nr:methylated-DNA--[protein]-cysteine S-methyltransferase [Ramlibacter tataouinensis]AEG93087.1 methylated DNA-protein cysteine methyltransferase-like protein [Ramlibacter tataouinensis TTB310]
MVAQAHGLALFPTPVGPCALAWNDGAIAGVHLPEADEAVLRRRMRQRFPGAREAAPPTVVIGWIERIEGLLAHGRDDLRDLPLDWRGLGEFECRVYQAARAIAPGRTLTYGELAALLGVPGAARAVGQALGRNPFAPVGSCHRVLAARNGAGGFSADGGVATKLRLLQIETAQFGATPGLFDPA